MRIIYVDEAGTAPAEPVRVVAGVLVDPDREYDMLTREMARIFDAFVPSKIRDGFVFHGKEVFNGGKVIKREDWPLDDRLDFFKEIACLPLVHDLPIAFGSVQSGDFGRPDDMPASLKLNHFEHGYAMMMMAERADFFLREYRGGLERGMIVAEDVPEIRALLGFFALSVRNDPIILSPEQLVQSSGAKARGEEPKGHEYVIRHIVDAPYFVGKGGAPLLQLADACAFILRRWLSRQRHGEELLMAMLGPIYGPAVAADSVWYTGSNSGLFNTDSFARG